MLDISDFSKSYSDQKIITIKDLQLKPGVNLIKGDNGSGKTTLFKCLAGILPFEGSVHLNEISMKADPIAYRYHVNFAEAEPLYPGFVTAKDLIRFVGKTKLATPEQEARYISELGVGPFFEKACDTYSSGMMKKVSLVLAFLGDAKMIILDEPLITLDEQTRSRLFKIIREKKETIFLLSSHQAIETQFLHIDRTFFIHDKTLQPE